MKYVTFTKYCKCGASWQFYKIPADRVKIINELWAREHSGPDCGEATAKEAGNARAKQERNFPQDM